MHCNPYLYAVLPLLSVGILPGCGLFIAGSVATGAVIAHDSRTTGTLIEDEAIEIKAGKAIAEDEELASSAHINVTSYNTKVLVTGEAPTEALREQVIAIVRTIEKVQDVYDEITLAKPSSLGSRSSDGLLTAKVKTQLLRIKGFDPTRVKVVTERGVVYLMGFLNRDEGNAVAAVARRVGGVQKVVKLFEYRG
jgi:osmotically-inducible protein OsmY